MEAAKPAKEWSFDKLPPKGDKDVGPYFYKLFDEAKVEKERLGINERMIDNHRLWRNSHWSETSMTPEKERVSLNFLFANIIRTVSNMTANNPVAEVLSADGIEDDADQILNRKMKLWNNESEHGRSLNRSALNMENYGITVEKHVWNAEKGGMDTVIVDPFSWFPAPGYFEVINDMPYMVQAYPMSLDAIRSKYNVPKDVEIYPEDTYSLLGEVRQETVIPSGTYIGSENYQGNYAEVNHPKGGSEYLEKKALVCEIWCRDLSEIEEEIVVIGQDGTEAVEKIKRPKYPGGIRVVHICNDGNIVLNDQGNPNINPALPREAAKDSFLFDTYPYFKANSYEDTTSVWGFAIVEQVGDILLKIDELFSRIAAYMARVTLPPLVLPKGAGISREQINNKPGLIIEPKSVEAAREIRYLQIPNLPSNFFDVLQAYISFFDRISQIEDADRGQAPKGIVAASAITALQERGARIMQAKIRSMDYLIRNRGRSYISFMQNFHYETETIEVNGEQKIFQGVEFAGRRYNYIVESGSTFYKPREQMQQLTMQLYGMGAIDQEALLEGLNYPNYKSILERMGESQLGAVGEALIQAGIPEQEVRQILEYAQRPQGGPGKRMNEQDGYVQAQQPMQGVENAVV